MAITFTELTAGSTNALRFQLLESGSPMDLSGLTVALIVENQAGTVISTWTVTVIDATTGLVDVTPTTTGTLNAANTPYYVRWSLTAADGSISYSPSGLRDVWHIVAK